MDDNTQAGLIAAVAEENLYYFNGAAGSPTPNPSPAMETKISPYLGDGDDFLYFGGSTIDSSRSFAQSLPSGEGLRQFGITLRNANTTDSRTALLFGGYFADINLAPGLIATGAFNDKAGLPGLSGSAQLPGKRIEEFLEFLKYVPSQLVMMKIRSSNIEQIGNPIQVKTLSPYQELPTEYIQPENAQDQYSNNDKVVTFMVEKQLDYSRLFEYVVEPDTTVSIIFYMGASLDTAVALERKRAKAAVTMNFIGGEKIQELARLQQARQLGM